MNQPTITGAGQGWFILPI